MAEIPEDQIERPEAWNKAYEENRHPWDLGSPTPEFMRLVREENLPAAKSRILIPGAGYGHDAVALAKLGYPVTAVEFAPKAANTILARARAENIFVNVIRRDFFALASEGGLQHNFDCILEYTFFCAIAPPRRSEYARACAKLLAPEGMLIGLFFPLEERSGGPPFSVSQTAVAEAFSPFFHLTFHQPQASVTPRKDREILGIFTKKPEEA